MASTCAQVTPPTPPGSTISASRTAQTMSAETALMPVMALNSATAVPKPARARASPLKAVMKPVVKVMIGWGKRALKAPAKVSAPVLRKKGPLMRAVMRKPPISPAARLRPVRPLGSGGRKSRLMAAAMPAMARPT